MNAILPLSPFFEEVFSTEETDQLYHQLYLNRGITPSEILVTHYKFGCVLLAGDLIGSNMPGCNSKSSAVVMAYWPNRGEDLIIPQCKLGLFSISQGTSFATPFLEIIKKRFIYLHVCGFNLSVEKTLSQSQYVYLLHYSFIK